MWRGGADFRLAGAAICLKLAMIFSGGVLSGTLPELILAGAVVVRFLRVWNRSDVRLRPVHGTGPRLTLRVTWVRVMKAHKQPVSGRPLTAAFTLIELLVVIAIIAILAAML